MVTEIGLDDADDLFGCIDWALETGIWDGRCVEWKDREEFHTELERRVMDYLFSLDQESVTFQRLAAQLAWIGSEGSERALIEREIDALQLMADGTVQQVGFFKKVGKFVKKNWVPIAIGIGVIVVVVAVGVIVASSGGTAAGAVVGAVAAGAKGLSDALSEDEQRPSSSGTVHYRPVESLPPKQVTQEMKLPSNQLIEPPPHTFTQYQPLFENRPLPDWAVPKQRVVDRPILESKPVKTESNKGAAIDYEIFRAYADEKVRERRDYVERLSTQNLFGEPKREPTIFDQFEGEFSTPKTPAKWEAISEQGWENNITNHSDLDKMEAAEESWIARAWNAIKEDWENSTFVRKVIPNASAFSMQREKNPDASSEVETPGSTAWNERMWNAIKKDWEEAAFIHKVLPPTSRFYTLPGIERSNIAILNGNGINTTNEEALAHARYVQNLASGYRVDWLHNQTHGPVTDLAECILLNYAGISINTAKQLREKWTAFHELNKLNPKAKILQICHSQGAIHVRNALMFAPQEIRDRVIVIAIAPAAVIPKSCCYESYNYACKTDFIPQGELAFAGALDPEGTGSMRRVMDAQSELILLDPHPNATGGINHDFQNPTYSERLENHLKEYINRNGEYE